LEREELKEKKEFQSREGKVHSSGLLKLKKQEAEGGGGNVFPRCSKKKRGKKGKRGKPSSSLNREDASVGRVRLKGRKKEKGGRENDFIIAWGKKKGKEGVQFPFQTAKKAEKWTPEKKGKIRSEEGRTSTSMIGEGKEGVWNSEKKGRRPGDVSLTITEKRKKRERTQFLPPLKSFPREGRGVNQNRKSKEEKKEEKRNGETYSPSRKKKRKKKKERGNL